VNTFASQLKVVRHDGVGFNVGISTHLKTARILVWQRFERPNALSTPTCQDADGQATKARVLKQTKENPHKGQG
jgi:hypothetical protein